MIVYRRPLFLLSTHPDPEWCAADRQEGSVIARSSIRTGSDGREAPWTETQTGTGREARAICARAAAIPGRRHVAAMRARSSRVISPAGTSR